MRTIRLEISYEGSFFSGSQYQKGLRTVQGEIEKALEKVTGNPVRLTIAGRTDSGVHANRQVAAFRTGSRIESKRFAPAVNSFHIQGLRVISSIEEIRSFDPRYGAKLRAYVYLLYIGDELPVFLMGKTGHEKERLDIKKMTKASKLMIGTHDFFNFSGRDKAQKKFRRTIGSLKITEVASDLLRLSGQKGKILAIKVTSKAFLYKMVRFIVGTLVEAGKSNVTKDQIKAMLTRKIDKKCKPVEACGLYHADVKY